MKNGTLSSGNKWILFGSIVVLALIIYIVWFHKWDEVAEKFQETRKSTVDPACKSNLETVLREWLRKIPGGLTDSNTDLGKIAAKCIHPFSLNTKGEKEQYYTSYGQFLTKLVGDSQYSVNIWISTMMLCFQGIFIIPQTQILRKDSPVNSYHSCNQRLHLC